MKILAILFALTFTQQLRADTINLTEEGVTAEDSVAFAQVIVQSSRSFSDRYSADNYCFLFQRSGLANYCHVRQYGSGYYESDFRLVLRGQGRTFFGALNAVLDFLNQINLLIDQVKLTVDFFSGSLPLK